MNDQFNNESKREMNKHIMRAVGLGEEVKKVEAGLCPVCGKVVCMDDFKKEIDRKEFYISGICQKCQDGIFDVPK